MNPKKSISQAIVWAVRQLSNLDAWLTGNAENDNPKKYEDLAPSRAIENGSDYFEALDFALRNREVKNVALTGTYGSGKSSILKAYQARRPQYRFLNISLATFDDGVTQNEQEREKIEISILQQMFYHVKYQKIPDSRFKRIRRLSLWKQFCFSLLVLLWIIAGGITARISYFIGLPLLKNLEGESYFLSVCFVLTAGTSFLFLFLLIRSFRQARFSKLNVIKGEIEVDEIGKTSILNTYLDEILYFFEVNAFNVVVIEDLDRFKDPAIFTKLREINNLLNNSEQIGRRIVFIYAIKDDMFRDRNRAKFFEFIIPVIPVINPSNSMDIFLHKLGAADMLDEINHDFLGVVTSYIDDMRMLKNILNEYQLYRHMLSDKLDQSTLFSIIIYKNLHPSDFAALHTGSGLIYDAFNNKPAYVARFTQTSKERVKTIEKQLTEEEGIHLRNGRELRMLYILQIISHIPAYSVIRATSVEANNFAYLEENKFEQVRNQTDIRYYDQYRNSFSGISFSAIEKEVDPNNTYEERLSQITRVANTNVDQLKKELGSLQKEISQMHTMTLSDILTTENSDVLPEELKKDKLTVYLLRNGYISEMYYAYISYFYEGSITFQDRNFLFSIWNYDPLPFDHELIKTGELVKRIALGEFSQAEILNFSLLDYLLINPYQSKNKCAAFFSFLASQKTKVPSFIDAYFERGRYLQPFVKQLATAWEGWWSWLLNKSQFTDEKLTAYLDALIRYADINDLVRLNKDNDLAIQLNRLPDFLTRFSQTELRTKIEALLEEFDIYFKELIFSNSTNELLNYIIEKERYEINPHMVTGILQYKKPVSLTASDWKKIIEEKNYSAIQLSACQPLINLIENNLEIYVPNVFVEIKTNTSETAENIVYLVNSESVENTDKVKILAHEHHVFENFDNIPESIHDAALIYHRIIPSWPNLLEYFGHSEEMDDALLAYLNTEDIADALGSAKPEGNDENKDLLDKLQMAIMSASVLSDSSYALLLPALSMQASPALAALSPIKINMLINKNLLSMSKQNFDALKAYGKNTHVSWLEKKASYTAKNISKNLSLEWADYAALLNSNNLTTVNKWEIIPQLTPAIIAEAIDLADFVLELCLQQNQVVPTELFKAVFDHLTGQNERVVFLSLQLGSLTVEQVRSSLDALGEPYSHILNRGQTKLSLTPENSELARALDLLKYVSSASIEERKGIIRINQFRKKG